MTVGLQQAHTHTHTHTQSLTQQPQRQQTLEVQTLPNFPPSLLQSVFRATWIRWFESRLDASRLDSAD